MLVRGETGRAPPRIHEVDKDTISSFKALGNKGKPTDNIVSMAMKQFQISKINEDKSRRHGERGKACLCPLPCECFQHHTSEGLSYLSLVRAYVCASFTCWCQILCSIGKTCVRVCCCYHNILKTMFLLEHSGKFDSTPSRDSYCY